MSFSYRPIIIGIMMMAFFHACGNKEKGNDICFDKVSVSRDIALTDDADSPRCRISIEVDHVKSGDDEKDKTINAEIIKELFNLENLTMSQAADSFANTYVRNYKESLTKLYSEDKTESSRHSWYEYNYTLKTETQTGRNGIIIYIASLNFYEGGSHGITQKLVTNFDINTGKKLALEDVFVPGYEHQLNEVLLTALEEKVGVRGIAGLHKEGYLYSLSIFAPENFIIGEKAITFIYNVYEIAPYAKGLTELTIEYPDIEHLLIK